VVKKSSVFWDIMPCSEVKVAFCFRGTCRLHLHGGFLHGLSFEATSSSETWVDFHRGHIPEIEVSLNFF
jgi:hypothetical protein